jgi:hypothetical protein
LLRGESLLAHAKGAYALSKQQGHKGKAPPPKSEVVVPPKSGIKVAPKKGLKPVGTVPKTGTLLDPKALSTAVIHVFTAQSQAKSNTSHTIGRPGINEPPVFTIEEPSSTQGSQAVDKPAGPSPQKPVEEEARPVSHEKAESEGQQSSSEEVESHEGSDHDRHDQEPGQSSHHSPPPVREEQAMDVEAPASPPGYESGVGEEEEGEGLQEPDPSFGSLKWELAQIKAAMITKEDLADWLRPGPVALPPSKKRKTSHTIVREPSPERDVVVDIPNPFDAERPIRQVVSDHTGRWADRQANPPQPRSRGTASAAPQDSYEPETPTAIQAHNEWLDIIANSDADLRVKGAPQKAHSLFPFRREKEVKHTLSLVQEGKDDVSKYWAKPYSVSGCSAKQKQLYKVVDPEDEVAYFLPRGPTRAFALAANAGSGSLNLQEAKLPPGSLAGKLAARAQEDHEAANVQLRAAYLQAQSIKTMSLAMPGLIEDIEPINQGLHANLVAVQQGLDYSMRVAADMLDLAARHSTRAAQDQRSAWLLHAKFPKERETALLRMPLLPGSVNELGEELDEQL